MPTSLKEQAAGAALTFIPAKCVLGVGTGSTVDALIAQLPAVRHKIDKLVASSVATARQLELNGFRCSSLEAVGTIDLYIDGADEVDPHRQMIKGGGGAHTREKILAVCARQFVAIVDDSKQVSRLGRFPLAVEVVPFARSYVARQLAIMGGSVEWRCGITTDNGNQLLDVRLLDLTDAVGMETKINNIVGVVENGLFARRPADTVIIANPNGIRQL